MRRKSFDALVSAGGVLLTVVLVTAGILLYWGYSSIATFVLAAVAAVLSVLGLLHFRRVPLEEEIPRLAVADVFPTRGKIGGAKVGSGTPVAAPIA
jgi:hypothetical protein